MSCASAEAAIGNVDGETRDGVFRTRRPQRRQRWSSSKIQVWQCWQVIVAFFGSDSLLPGARLQARQASCYGARLKHPVPRSSPEFLSTRNCGPRLGNFSTYSFVLVFALLLNAPFAGGQSIDHQLKATLPGEDEIRFESITEDSSPPNRLLHKMAKIVTSDMVISADEIQYNSDTNWAHAQGHVHLEHFVTGDKINADRAEYNLKTQSGKFYLVDGTAPSKIVASPTVLTTTNPFYFQAQWAERIKDRYILHEGFLTDCTVKKPWWTFEAPVFDVIPGQRAIARNTVFRLRGVPIFYLPYFYRPLGKNQCQSGFLTPNIGHSSLYGYIVGLGYYWAINRSYDTTIIGEYFTQRGPALRYDFRGKPNEVTDFDFNLYGVNDSQDSFINGVPTKSGGLEFE